MEVRDEREVLRRMRRQRGDDTEDLDEQELLDGDIRMEKQVKEKKRKF